MKRTEQYFLEALAASLRGERVQWENPLEAQDWAALFQLAQAHHVLPMIFEAVYACPAARCADAQLMLLAKRQTMQIQSCTGDRRGGHRAGGGVSVG